MALKILCLNIVKRVPRLNNVYIWKNKNKNCLTSIKHVENNFRYITCCILSISPLRNAESYTSINE